VTIPWQATLVVAMLSAVAMPLVARRLPWSVAWRPLALLALGFTVHNTLLSLGLSLRGELPDQMVLLSEWCVACLAIAYAFLAQPLPPSPPSLLRTALAVPFNLLIGLLFVASMSDEFGHDRVYIFSHHGARYETRRFSDYGWAWSANVRYEFETYRLYPLLVAERKVHDYWVMSHCSRLDFDGPTFTVAATDSAGQTLLVLQSGGVIERHAFSKFPCAMESNITPSR
jgi:hypothetical protein